MYVYKDPLTIVNRFMCFFCFSCLFGLSIWFLFRRFLMSFGSEIQSLLVGQMQAKAESNTPLVGEFINQMKSESDALALATINTASAMLVKAKADDSPQSVIDAYERILTRASSR